MQASVGDKAKQFGTMIDPQAQFGSNQMDKFEAKGNSSSSGGGDDNKSGQNFGSCLFIHIR